VYGGTDAARRPPTDVMKNLDAVVFDVQDAGARYYTTRLRWDIFWKARQRRGLSDCAGPARSGYGLVCARSGFGCRERKFYGLLDRAGAAGMTMGELAKMFNAERNIKREADRGADGWLAARGLVRFDGASLGESVAEFAERDRGGAVSGRGDY